MTALRALALSLVAVASVAASATTPAGMVRVGAGVHEPLYELPGDRRQPVDAFYLGAVPVTNADFLAFVRAHPEWRRSRVRRLFADAGYLQHWAGDLTVAPAMRHQPVVHVSWHAATAYARWRGHRLPTTAEWEWAAAAGRHSTDARREPATVRDLLMAYSRPAPAVLPDVGRSAPNVWGARDLHGLVFEWVADFHTALGVADSRQGGDRNRGLFCGAGSVGASRFADYTAFLRYGYRTGLRASDTVGAMGFRTALDA